MIIAAHMEPTAKDAALQVAQGHSQPLTVGMARIDDPPPYFLTQPFTQSFQQPSRPVPPIARAASCSNLAPQRPRPKPTRSATNNLFIKTRHEPIGGTFVIDPDLQTVALDKAGATAIDRRDYNRKHRQRHRHHGRKSFKKRTDLPDPNAIFETRQGSMALDLAIAAAPNSLHSRTLVQATTRQGPVDIKVRDIHPRRRLNLEVTTRKGDILILIPRSFSGYIQLYSRHGQLVFLTNLAQTMTLVSRHEREAQVVVGDATNRLPAKGAEWAGDTMHVSSRDGDVFVGYIGEDHKPVAQPGLWDKLISMFRD